MRVGLSLGAIAALQIIASLAAQLMVLRIVGVGWQTDAYIAAQAVPLVLLAVLSGSLQHVWQPRLALAALDRDRWSHEQSTAQGQVLLAYGTTALGLALSALIWTPWLFPGFEANQQRLAASLALPLFAASALNCHSAVTATALRATDRFVTAEATPFAGTILSLGLILLLVPRWGVDGAAWAALTRAVGVCAALHVQAGRPDWSVRRAVEAAQAWRKLRPLVAGSSLYKASPLVDKYWGSLAPAGGLTALSLAQLASSSTAVVLDRAFNVPVVPQLARLVEQRRFSDVRTLYRRCLLRVSICTLVLGCALIALEPLVALALTALLATAPEVASQVWLLTLLFLGYLHVSACGAVVTASFMALGDARTPVTIGVIGFIVGVGLKSAGFLTAGLPGLALATSVYYAGNLLAMSLILERRLDAQLP
jgi:putative peptidoglycan lipid II flippase